MFTILFAMTIDASTFNEAAKRFVKMNRNYNIGQLIVRPNE